jgi:hypothetical protein
VDLRASGSITSVTDPTLHPDEAFLLAAIASAMREEGRVLGPVTVRDGRRGDLRIDVTFDADGVAIELTTITDAEWAAGTAEAAKLADRLAEYARKETLGGWFIGLSASTDMRSIEPELRDLMREGREFVPMSYLSSDLVEAERRGQLDDFLSRHRRLAAAGLTMLRKSPAYEGVRIGSISGGGAQITGFADLLAECISSKLATLAEARRYETHLGVLVTRWDASDHESETPPPRLPPELDRLWVVHCLRTRDEIVVWALAHDQCEWTVHRVVVEPPHAPSDGSGT